MSAPISSPIPQQSAGPMVVSSAQQSHSAKIIPPRPAQFKAPSTDIFLRDFTLVAEAAKRAQMAVMVRDFEGCGLS